MSFFDWVQENIKYFIGAGILAANIYTFYNYFSGKPNQLSIPPKKQRDHPIRVKEIFIYPIKSCSGISVKSIKIDKFGFELDRRWMIVSNGRFITQRQYPKMSLIKPRIEDINGEKYLIVGGDGSNSQVKVKVNEDLTNKQTIRVGIWKDEVNVIDCGDEAHHWLSKFLELDDARLVRMAPGSEYHRRVPEDYIDNIIDNASEHQREQYQFALCDTSQVMMVSQASIDDLNQHIVANRKQHNEQQRDPVTVYNFRPNVLLSSCDAFEEDTWNQVRISGLLLKKVQYTPRCKLTTVDPSKGILDPYNDEEPLRTLRTYREFDKKLLFGVLFVHEQDQNGEEINVGDIIDVLSESNDPYPIKK